MLEEESILPFGRESVGGVGSRKSCEVLKKHKKLNMFQCNQQTWVLAVNNIKFCNIQASSFQSMRPLFKSLKVYRAGEGGRMKANFGAKINFS